MTSKAKGLAASHEGLCCMELLILLNKDSFMLWTGLLLC